MTFFKNFFTVAAVVAVSFSASAQPVSQDYTDYNLDGYAISSVDADEPFVFDRDFFELFVMYMNNSTPYELTSGIEISSVTLDDNGINLNATCDEFMAYGLSYLNEEQIDQLKAIMAGGMCEIFQMFGEDDEGDTIIDKMKKLDINMNYNFYIKDQDTPVTSISLTAQYIYKVGRQNMALHMR